MAKAACYLSAGPDSKITGSVTLTQEKEGDDVVINGKVSGLEPHHYRVQIHEYGDITNGWKSTGKVFNPEDKPRPPGDLGTIDADVKGDADVKLKSAQIALSGKLSVIALSVVLHDLGKGGGEESLETHKCDPEVAWGVIGVAK